MRARSIHFYFPCLLPCFIARVLADGVSLSVNYVHACVQSCLLTNNHGFYDDMGDAMSCGLPYQNDCYCATAPASASKATSWVPKCITSSCAAGDLTADLSAAESAYASYCMGAGFTQPDMTAWYNPATTSVSTAEPSKTTGSGPPATTTEVTVVTQTRSTTNRGVSTTQPPVTVHTTSTVWVGSPGSSTWSSGSGSNKLALGVGLGVGIPLGLVALAIGIWLCRRNRRRPGSSYQPPPAPPGYFPPVQSAQSMTMQSPAPPAGSSIQRKPVAPADIAHSPSPMSHKSELTGDPLRREIGGQEVHPFPVISPSSPVALPGEHELSAQSRTPELQGHIGGQFAWNQAGHQQPGGRDRWELP